MKTRYLKIITLIILTAFLLSNSEPVYTAARYDTLSPGSSLCIYSRKTPAENHDSLPSESTPAGKPYGKTRNITNIPTLEEALLESDMERTVDITSHGIKALYESAEEYLLRNVYSSSLNIEAFLERFKQNTKTMEKEDFYEFFIKSIEFLLMAVKNIEPNMVSEDEEKTKDQNPLSRLFLEMVLYHTENINRNITIILVDNLPVNSVRYYDNNSGAIYIAFDKQFVSVLIETFNRLRGGTRNVILWIFVERLIHELAHDNVTTPYDLGVNHYRGLFDSIKSRSPDDFINKLVEDNIAKFEGQYDRVGKNEETFVSYIDFTFFRYIGHRIMKAFGRLLNEPVFVRVIDNTPVTTPVGTTLRKLLRTPGLYYKFLRRLNNIWNNKLKGLEAKNKESPFSPEALAHEKLQIEKDIIQIISSEWVEPTWSRLPGKGFPGLKKPEEESNNEGVLTAETSI